MDIAIIQRLGHMSLIGHTHSMSSGYLGGGQAVPHVKGNHAHFLGPHHPPWTLPECAKGGVGVSLSYQRYEQCRLQICSPTEWALVRLGYVVCSGDLFPVSSRRRFAAALDNGSGRRNGRSAGRSWTPDG